MPLHAIELDRSTHAKAKAAATEEGITLDAYLSREIAKYGREKYTPIRRPPRSERDVTRVKLGIEEKDWQAASERAKNQATSVTIALIERLSS